MGDDVRHEPSGRREREPGRDRRPGSTSRRRGRTPSADVERELLAAAETVLVRDGPGGLTVRAVAAEAGIAPMGVYNKLGGKDGLVDALLIRGFDRLGRGHGGGHRGHRGAQHARPASSPAA